MFSSIFITIFTALDQSEVSIRGSLGWHSVDLTWDR